MMEHLSLKQQSGMTLTSVLTGMGIMALALVGVIRTQSSMNKSTQLDARRMASINATAMIKDKINKGVYHQNETSWDKLKDNTTSQTFEAIKEGDLTSSYMVHIESICRPRPASLEGIELEYKRAPDIVGVPDCFSMVSCDQGEIPTVTVRFSGDHGMKPNSGEDYIDSIYPKAKAHPMKEPLAMAVCYGWTQKSLMVFIDTAWLLHEVDKGKKYSVFIKSNQFHYDRNEVSGFQLVR